jgi:hypothetical protein
MSDPIAAAQALTASLDTMAEQLKALAARQDEQIRYGRRNRHLIWGLVVSLVLDLALTIAVVGVGVATNQANSKANEAHSQQIATCRSGNEARAVNIQLWDYIFSVKPVTPRTAAQEGQIAEFKKYVHRAFAPRDCSKI